jgi:hypothetical protein
MEKHRIFVPVEKCQLRPIVRAYATLHIYIHIHIYICSVVQIIFAELITIIDWIWKFINKTNSKVTCRNRNKENLFIFRYFYIFRGKVGIFDYIKHAREKKKFTRD